MTFAPIVPAHGALGIWDEVVFIGVGITFVVVMVYSALQSRSMTPEIAPDPTDDSERNETTYDADDRFTLD